MLMDTNLYIERIIQAETDFGSRPGENYSWSKWDCQIYQMLLREFYSIKLGSNVTLHNHWEVSSLW